MELGLSGKRDRAIHRERQPGISAPFHRQPDRLRGVQLGGQTALARVRGGVGERRPHLVGHLVLGEEAEQPSLRIGVGLDIGPQHFVPVPLPNAGEDRPLQQTELGGGVAGGHSPDAAGFKQPYPLALPGEQQRGGKPGEARAGHQGVVRLAWRRRRPGGQRPCGVEP